jgi:hypothetical protein
VLLLPELELKMRGWGRWSGILHPTDPHPLLHKGGFYSAHLQDFQARCAPENHSSHSGVGRLVVFIVSFESEVSVWSANVFNPRKYSG